MIKVFHNFNVENLLKTLNRISTKKKTKKREKNKERKKEAKKERNNIGKEKEEKMAFEVTYEIFDTDKGETPPESGEYNVLYENGEWSRAIWDERQLSLSRARAMCLGEWKEWFGESKPHLWAHKKR